LSRVAQALKVRLCSIGRPWPVVPGCCVIVLALSGCASGGFSMKQAEVDRSLYTSNIPAAGKTKDTLQLSDEATVRDAVSSVDISTLGSSPLSWANTETGARGSITELAEYSDRSLLCRKFTTSRISFDGVKLYRGETCRGRTGGWLMHSFDAVDARA
jgi:surface antigen